MRLSKWLFLLLPVVLFIFAPSIDGIACNECAKPFRGGDSSNHLCSFCFNTVGMVNHDIFHVPLISIPMDTDGPMIAFSGPTFQIDKPPQN
jgi:hypothetical protein